MAALGIELDEVACNVLYLLLGALLEPFPGTCAEGTQSRSVAGAVVAILGNLVERVDRHIHNVVVLVDDAYHLLIGVAGRHAHQTAELAYAEVYVHQIVARVELLQFLHGECHLAGTCAVGTETVLVEAVEYLGIGKEAHLQVVVGKALVERLVHWDEGDGLGMLLLGTFGEDVLESLVLLLAVGEDVEPVACKDIVFERLRQQLEVLVEERLGRNVELHRGAWRACGRMAELHTAEL